MTLNLKLKQNYKAYLLIGYAFLLLTHFVLKDNVFPISILFYAFPLPILILGAIILSLLFFRRKMYSLSLAGFAILLTAMWLNTYYLKTESILHNETSKILYWNLAKKDRLPIAYISEKTNTYQPEILAFVEATLTTLSNLDSLTLAMPGYEFKTLKGAMLVGVKGKIETIDFHSQPKSYKANLLTIKTKTKDFKFIVTDINAYPTINKKAPLKSVLDLAQSQQVDFIIGDFNTPYESVYFKNYKEDFVSFHSYNNGFTATWPLGIPLLEIDHIWMAKKYQAILLEKFYNDASDHALLISEFRDE